MVVGTIINIDDSQELFNLIETIGRSMDDRIYSDDGHWWWSDESQTWHPVTTESSVENKSYEFSDFSVDEALSQTTKQNVVLGSDNKIHSTNSKSQSSNVTVESSQSPLPAIILMVIILVIIFVSIVPEAGFFVLVGVIGIFLIWAGDQGSSSQYTSRHYHDSSTQNPSNLNQQPNQNFQHSAYYNQSTGEVEHIFHKGTLRQNHYVRTNQKEPSNSEHIFKIK